MKKYISGTLAVIVAIIAMSFTQSSKQKGTVDTSYHWFANAGQNDADLGSIIPGTYLGYDTKANMLAGALATCTGDDAQPFCATGYSPADVEPVSGEYRVKFSEETGYEQPVNMEDAKIREDDER